MRLAACLCLLTAVLAAMPLPAAAEWVNPWAVVPGPTAGPARVIGAYSQGCVAGAEALPPDGPGYQSIRAQWRRNYGHAALVDYVRQLGARVEAAGLGIAVIADMAQPRGGPITGHASHESGLDVDIWFRLDRPRLLEAERRTLQPVSMVDPATGRVDAAVWTEAHATLVRLAAADPRVARIFVNPAIKRALCRHDWPEPPDWLRLVRPWSGHDAHMHIRLHCPDGSRTCEGQPPPPPGTGCADDAGAMQPDRAADSLYGGSRMPRPRGVLPPACVRVWQGR